MLASASTIDAVANIFQEQQTPIVLDPVWDQKKIS